MSFYPVTAAAVQLMTFSYLHLKLPQSRGIYPNSIVEQSSRNTHTNLHKLRKRNWTREREREEEEQERDLAREREREKRERAEKGRDWHCLSVRCPELRCALCHPHDRAVCRGHLPHYGKCMHLGQALAGSSSAWAGKMAHWQLLLHYVSKLYTLHAYILHWAREN